MRRISVGLPVVGLYLLALCVVTGSLVSTAYKYRQLLQTDGEKAMAAFAKKGQALPPLSGHSRSGAPITVLPESSRRFLLMVFRQDCRYCAENWHSWDRILADKARRGGVIFYSTDDEVSGAYQAKHPSVGSFLTVLGASPGATATLGLDATPQTVLVDHGNVVRNWPGVLSSKDETEIMHAMEVDPGN
jgi:hypothetical protein